MLSPFLKGVLTNYDEKAYRISDTDAARIFSANANMEEDSRLDVRLPAVARWRVVRTLRSAGIDLRNDAVVIDLCCGTGYVARSLVSAGVVSTITGMDLSAGQLRIMQQAVKRESHGERIPVARVNSLSLPVRSGSVDVVIGNSFLHHFPDVNAALCEIRRVLAPGGRFIVLHEPSVTATFFESFPLSLVKRIVVRNYTDLWQFHASELERLLEQAGFRNVRIRRSGVFANVLLGGVSILANKYLKSATTLHLGLEYVRAALYIAEYRLSLSFAPSLLVDASVPVQ